MCKINESLRHFQETYSDDMKHYAEEVALRESRYIFIEGKGKCKKAHCTHCKLDFELTEKVKHLSYMECPGCGGTHQIRLVSISRKYFIDEVYFVYFEKSTMDAGTVVARGVYAKRDYRYDYRFVHTTFEDYARYIFTHGEGGVMLRRDYYSSGWNSCESIYCLSANTFLKSVQYFESRVSVRDAIAGTSFQYLPWDNRWCLLKFFGLASKYPLVVEYLIKSGFSEVVRDKMYGRSTHRAVNWQGKTLQEITKLPLETPTAKAASRLTSVGFLLPKAKSISGIADVQDEGISLPLPIQCV